MADRPDCTIESIASRLKVDKGRIEQGVDALVSAEMIARTDMAHGCELALTELGDDAIDRLRSARRVGLTELLEGWDPESHPEIGEMVRHLAHELLADDDKLLADATVRAPTTA